jgi:hypothetical protein
MKQGHLDDLDFAAVAERLCHVDESDGDEKSNAISRLAEFMLEHPEIRKHLGGCGKCMKEVLDIAKDLEELNEAIKNMTPEQHAECDRMAEVAKQKIFDLLWLDKQLKEFGCK